MEMVLSEIRMSKKVIFLKVIGILGMIMLLTGCGSISGEAEDEIVGTWKAVSVEIGETVIDIQEYIAQSKAPEDGSEEEEMAVFEIGKDKTVSMNIWGDRTTGTWEKANDSYLIIVEDGTEEIKIEDGKMVIGSEELDVKIIFEKIE